MILVDSDVLLRITQPGHLHRQAALDAIESLRGRDAEEFATCPQTLYEMYVVCTRPVSANSLGMTPQRAHAEVVAARALFQGSARDAAGLSHLGKGSSPGRPPAGKRAHDARLAALMIEHHVPRLLTFNDADFARFVEIVAMNPFDVLGISRV